jgi:hypothetical protein
MSKSGRKYKPPQSPPQTPQNPNTVFRVAQAGAEHFTKPADLAAAAKRKHILISIPTYSGDISYATYASMIRSSTAAHQNGWACDMSVRATDSVLKRARDVMLSEFIDRFHDATDMLFVDSDVSWTAEGFVKIMSHDVDIVGAAYRSRGDPEVYVLSPVDNELQRDVKTGLMEVRGLGTGFMRISKRAAKMIADARGPDAWYNDPTAPGLKIRDVFDFKVVNHGLVSEDYLFCDQWRALGGKVWLDPDQDMGHSGHKLFSGNLMK